MIQLKLLSFLSLLVTTFELSSSVGTVLPKVDPQERFEYSLFIVEAAREHNMDPYLVAAVVWHESGFRNLPRNRTNDYGVMQVHWQHLNVRAGEVWLDGLSRQDLMDPRTNIRAGVAELSYYRGFCSRRGHRHHWWVHYKYGPDRVEAARYGQKINWRYRKLRRSRKFTGV